MGENKIDKKKLIEKWAVRCFLINTGVNPTESLFMPYPEEPADIIYENQEFQVTTAPAEVEAVVGRLDREEVVKIGNTEGEWVKFGPIRVKSWGSSCNIEESFDLFIIKPIENKLDHYGRKSTPIALKDINLLIFCYNSIVSPWNEELFDEFKKSKSDYFKKTGFKSIYLLDQKTNIKIYP
ncbi:MAG: hypothetical protein ABH873_04130 [Candidatus Firestonebacteria bacterium]